MKIERLYSDYDEYYDEKLYSTGNDELDDLLERAFSEGYEYAQKEFTGEVKRANKTRKRKWEAAQGKNIEGIDIGCCYPVPVDADSLARRHLRGEEFSDMPGDYKRAQKRGKYPIKLTGDTINVKKFRLDNDMNSLKRDSLDYEPKSVNDKINHKAEDHWFKTSYDKYLKEDHPSYREGLKKRSRKRAVNNLAAKIRRPVRF